MRNIIVILFLFVSNTVSYGQSGVIKGKIYNQINNQPLSFANAVVQGTTSGAVTDDNGSYEITGLVPGLYNLQVSFVGFKSAIVYEIQVSNAKPTIIDIGLEENVKELKEVEVTGSTFDKSEESPLSLRTIGVNEIQRNPGGNRDISKVIQSFPGVASVVTFRNDILIRGGAPNENRFYLDGVEVPNINHFATQGSSGGPIGMINVDFIKEVEFYSGAFPANRGNALSSVFNFTQRDGRSDRLGFTATVGSSDLGLTLEGPVGKKSTFMLSARRSYLQLLFKTLGLPFLPTYNDFQFKQKIKFNSKNELSIIGLGAIDQFSLNLTADSTDLQRYILGNLPENSQWNYTGGLVFKHFGKNNFTTVIASRNHLNNEARKYFNNDKTQSLLLDYSSQEIENKFRIENNYYKGGFKLNYGAGYEYVTYGNKTYVAVSTAQRIDTIDFNSTLNFSKYFAFGQVTKGFFKEHLMLSLGLRSDMNDYSAEMSNPLQQVSPRFSVTYNVAKNFSVNFNSGIYYQLPAYTVLGYRDGNNALVNKQNKVKFISCQHIVTGVEYYTKTNARISVEGFYKYYQRYPFLTRDSISLANLGADFGVVGNAPVESNSTGRTYGVEFFVQQKLYKGFYGILAVTLFRSEFKDRNDDFVPSSWDSRYVVTTTLGKKFKRNWEVGAKWRFSGGSPYTPVDSARSSLIAVWDISGQGIPDYSRLNTKRLPLFHQLDMRIDKKYFFKHFNLNIYFDVQNVYAFKATFASYLDVKRDDLGNPLVNPISPDAYQTYLLENKSGSVIPSVGLIFEL